GTEKRLPGAILTGVPLRQEFKPRTPEVPPRRLLVTGGSQGARRINEAVWSALGALCARFEEVIHVAGEQGAEGVKAQARDRYTGLTFTDDMAGLMARADLVISRAGVSTIAEAAAVGLPMILVPGTFGGGHQLENAAAIVAAGGAGVSALARVFLARGDDVSGCDLKETETTAELEEAGVRFMVGHDPEHVLGQDLLVYSGAIKRSAELEAARAMGVRVLSRAE